jgi:hypothetical protein
MRDFKTIEKGIDAALEKIKDEMLADNTVWARKNLPKLEGDSMELYLEGPYRKCQKLIEGLNQEVQVNTTIGAAGQVEAGLKARLAESEHKLILTERKLTRANNELSGLRWHFQVQWWRMVQALLIIFCIGDAFLNSKVAECWGFNAIESIFVGTTLSFLFLAIGHFTPWIVGFGRNRAERIIIIITISTLVSALFYWLGKTRADYLSALAHGAGAMIEYSPFPFMLISVFFFLVCALATTMKPTPEMVKENKILKEKKLEVRNIEAEMHGLEAEKARLGDEIGRNRVQTASDLEGSASLERKIVETAHELCNLFKTQNLMLRLDRERPQCFSGPYPFEFTLYFSRFNKSLQQ